MRGLLSASMDAIPVEHVTTNRNRYSDPASDAASGAFASTLATMLTPPPPPQPQPDRSDATSELDDNRTRVDATSSDARGTASSDRSMRSADGGAAAGTASSVSGKPAHDAAAAARAAASGQPVTEVNNDGDALSPEFRTRLGRVVTRMRDEYGHDVQMVEGFRTQDRQDFLYEQGRTRPGAVVTWTRSSKHTLGLAADLKIDGSYDNPAAYQALATVAAQEGLRTLGARDPGHVELPSRAGAAAWGSSLDSLQLGDSVTRAVGLAIAGDSPASAKPSADGLNGLLSRVNRSHAMHAPAAAAGSAGSFSGDLGNGSGSNNSGSGRDQRGSHPAAATGVATAATVAQVAAVAHVAQVAHVANVASPAVPGTHGVVAAPMSDAADRVGRILDVRDASPAQPLSHVTLDVDNAAGGSDRVTVQLRSGAVDTSIALSDTSRADKLSLRVGELQHALEQHGIEAGAIRVSSTGTDANAGWSPRHGGDNQDATQRQAPNTRDRRQEADDSRQRSRREQQGGKQQ